MVEEDTDTGPGQTNEESGSDKDLGLVTEIVTEGLNAARAPKITWIHNGSPFPSVNPFFFEIGT
jgi:hypothetical protein